MSTITETVVCSGIIHSGRPVRSGEQLSPGRLGRWRNLVAGQVAAAPNNARAITITVGEADAVAQLDTIAVLKHLVVLRDVSSYVRTDVTHAGDLTEADQIQATKFYSSLKTEMSLAEVYDVPESKFINWVKTSRLEIGGSDVERPSHNRIAFQEFLETTTAQISSNTSTEAMLTPEPKYLTVDDACSAIDPTNFAGSIDVLVHEHTLGNVFDALVFLKTSNLIPDEGKKVWTTVVLQITAKSHTGELKGSPQKFGEVVATQRAHYGNSEWTNRTRAYANSYASKIRRKQCLKAIREGLLVDPGKYKLTDDKVNSVDDKVQTLIKINIFLFTIIVVLFPIIIALLLRDHYDA
jgi:hypothetical protein